jgi:opacity protein-like surface antigen
MTRKTAILASAAALGLAGNVAAEEPGFYAFAGLGSAKSERALNAVERFDGDDFSYQLGLGFSINRYFAVQAAYHDFGKVDAIAGCPPELLCIADPGTGIVPSSPDTVNLDGVSVQIVGTMPLNTVPLQLFGKLGAMAWDSNWRQNSRLDESHTDLLYGVGVNWAPTDRWGMHLEYQKLDLDVRSFTLGTTFRF